MTSRSAESAAMRLARRFGAERIAWGLRRLHCPVPPHALVLEVGSGGNPYARANVLLDAYPDTRERHWVPLTVDRPFVFGFLERLPFKDKCFDFVIASHVLEHSAAPERALAEMQRVAHAGYIEVPDAFMERINPYLDHRVEIAERQERLILRKKPRWLVDPELAELYEPRAKALIAGHLIPARPFDFHVRHYWENSIDFHVMNPDVDASWPAHAELHGSPPPPPIDGVRAVVRHLLRRLLSQTRRNRALDWTALLACPTCLAPGLDRRGRTLVCAACETAYPDRNGVPMLYPRAG